MQSPELANLFARTRAGNPVDLGDVALVPLLLSNDEGIDADLLEEGLRAGRTSVKEASHGGNVNAVNVTHSGVRMLLLVDGEEIVGAKQNRILNASFLVPPGASVQIPVSCVEKGRWRYDAPGFAASGRTMTSVARAEKLKRVTASVSIRRGYDADQRAVWRDVDGYLDRTHVTSATSAFADAVASRTASVEERMSALRVAPGQIGLAAVRGGSVIALDVFGSRMLYARAWKKVARGMLAEVNEGAAPCGDARAIVEQVLRALADAQVVRTPAPGCGETLHGIAPGVVVGAVAEGGRVYHAVVTAA